MVETVTDNSFSGEKPNLSYNSYARFLQPKLSPTERRIVAILEEDSGLLSPDSIRAKISLKYDQLEVPAGTIRPLLRNLAKRGLIHNPYKGFYCDKLTYDVRVKPVAVHNVRLHCVVGGIVEHFERTVEVGGVKIFVCFGKERGIVSGRISYDAGMSRAACMLAVDKWVDVAEEHLGYSLGELVLTRLEVNRDDVGASFDGSLSCASRDVLKDVIVQRVYEKEDCLRQEFCVRKSMTPKQLEDSLFVKGMDNFLLSIAGHEQDRKLSNLEKTQKSINLKLQDINSSSKAIEQKIVSGSSKEDFAYRLLVDLKEENCRMMAFMEKKYDGVLGLLTAKAVENEELKRMVLTITDATAKLTEALSKSHSESVQSNEKIGGNDEYVR